MRGMITLQVFVQDDCWSCAESRRIVAALRPDFPDVRIELLNLQSEPHPDSVFAAPTYLLNGRVYSLGNPYPTDLSRALEAARQRNGM